MNDHPNFESFDHAIPSPFEQSLIDAVAARTDAVNAVNEIQQTSPVPELQRANDIPILNPARNHSAELAPERQRANEVPVLNPSSDAQKPAEPAQVRQRANDVPILNPSRDANKPAEPLRDLSYVGILDLTQGEDWNCGTFVWSAPLLGQDYRSFVEPEEPEPEPIVEDVSLTEDESDVVERLAEWLIEVRGTAEEAAGLEFAVDGMGLEPRFRFDGLDKGDQVPANPGLFRLVEEFTSLRQDVKLQAKSARGLQEQATSMLDGMNRAIDQFQSVSPREQLVARDAVKPVLESLTDLDAALDRGRLAAEAARIRWLDDKSDHWNELVEAQLNALPVWKRWFARKFSSNLANDLKSQFTESWSASQNAQVDGYRLVQNRLRRLLQQQKVERMETIGRMADPNFMTVVDVADHDELPAGTVLEELRPGYLWAGQLLRYAEVRVVRARSDSKPELQTGQSD